MDGLDYLAVEGAVDNYYSLPNIKMDYCMIEPIAKIGFWRSVGYSHNIFFVESFVDEIASRANQDPYQFRRKLLRHDPLLRKVLDRAAEIAGWNAKTPPNRAQGMAIFRSQRWQTSIAQVAELEQSGERIVVRRIVVVADCGRAINPTIIKQQLEGATLFGLTAALKTKVSFKDGRPITSNFHNYPMILAADTPVIDVELLEYGEFVGGVGELGTPAIAPVIANAIYRLSGRRYRSLPLTDA